MYFLLLIFLRRLNPRLMKSCRHDLPKFCSSIMMPESKDYNPIGDRDFYEGKVISCLKDSFAQGKPLTKKCQCKYIQVALRVDCRVPGAGFHSQNMFMLRKSISWIHEFLGFVVDLTNIFCIEAFLSHSVPQIGIQINSQYHLTQGHSTRDDTIPPEAVEARDLTTWFSLQGLRQGHHFRDGSIEVQLLRHSCPWDRTLSNFFPKWAPSGGCLSTIQKECWNEPWFQDAPARGQGQAAC